MSEKNELARPLPAGPFGSPLDRKKALKASRPPTLSDSMIPDGATLLGKIIDISIPKDSKFKTPMMLVENESGMEFVVPLWASIKKIVGETKEEWKAVIGHRISLTKMGHKVSPTYGKSFPVYDVVIE